MRLWRRPASGRCAAGRRAATHDPAGRLGGGGQRRDRLHPDLQLWLNRIEARSTTLRDFALDCTDHRNHRAEASMIRRYIIWRNKHAQDKQLRRLVAGADVA
nr:hypothetical protein [Frankia gtarii]